MRNAIFIIGLLAVGLTANCAAAQAGWSVSSLCELQTGIAQGKHQNVRVEGVFLPGLEGQGGLVNTGCSGRSTRIEFALKAHDNWEKLQQMSDKLEEVLVVFEGEFYGPPVPDPNLPEAIRKIYHPGWDYNSMTKLVVDAIRSVAPLPASNPCASTPARKWPCFQHDPTSGRESTGAELDQRTPDHVPLCGLQQTVKQGEQRSVQVAGIYLTGFEGSVLTDAACPDQSTWVELNLESTANKEQLRSMLDTAGKADVVFVGEFYGPGVPSHNLPGAIRKSYRPGWGHLGAFKTKLVVHAIQSVKPVASGIRSEE